MHCIPVGTPSPFVGLQVLGCLCAPWELCICQEIVISLELTALHLPPLKSLYPTEVLLVHGFSFFGGGLLGMWLFV